MHRSILGGRGRWTHHMRAGLPVAPGRERSQKDRRAAKADVPCGPRRPEEANRLSVRASVRPKRLCWSEVGGGTPSFEWGNFSSWECTWRGAGSGTRISSSVRSCVFMTSWIPSFEPSENLSFLMGLSQFPEAVDPFSHF